MAIIVIILLSLLTYYFPKKFQATPHCLIWKSKVRIVMEWLGKLSKTVDSIGPSQLKKLRLLSPIYFFNCEGPIESTVFDSFPSHSQLKKLRLLSPIWAHGFKPIVMKHFGPIALGCINNLFQAIYSTGYIPVEFRKSKVVFIPKPLKFYY